MMIIIIIVVIDIDDDVVVVIMAVSWCMRLVAFALHRWGAEFASLSLKVSFVMDETGSK